MRQLAESLLDALPLESEPGSVLGGLGYVAIGFYTLLFPAVLTGSAGLAYFLYRFREIRHTGQHTRSPF